MNSAQAEAQTNTTLSLNTAIFPKRQPLITPMARLAGQLETGYRPDVPEVIGLMDQLQKVIQEYPEFNYLTLSFDALSDSLHNAQRLYFGDLLFHGIEI